ncbi:MAG: hypothetical protein R3Y64_00365 [Peptostreptococcaceae bacterium]
MRSQRQKVIERLYEEISELYEIKESDRTDLEKEETILLYFNNLGYDYKTICEIVNKLL